MSEYNYGICLFSSTQLLFALNPYTNTLPFVLFSLVGCEFAQFCEHACLYRWFCAILPKFAVNPKSKPKSCVSFRSSVSIFWIWICLMMCIHIVNIVHFLPLHCSVATKILHVMYQPHTTSAAEFVVIDDNQRISLPANLCRFNPYCIGLKNFLAHWLMASAASYAHTHSLYIVL